MEKFQQRCKELVKRIAASGKPGVVVLFSGYEDERHRFVPESSFYYYTGLTEPGCIVVIHPDGSSVLWVPHYERDRSVWTSTIVNSSHSGAREIKKMGAVCPGIQLHRQTGFSVFDALVKDLEELSIQGQTIYMLAPALRLVGFDLPLNIQDGTKFIASQRRVKDRTELEAIYEAVNCTMHAQEAAALRISPDMYAYQVQAAVDFVFHENSGDAAFPTIVASGSESTQLHAHDNRKRLESGEIVIVDCGARIKNYCADLSRTYPVSGTFTDRQREVYNVVLETQQYVAQRAQPGHFLNNPLAPEMSLHHIAITYLKDHGYENCMPHAIGHFLGLDVHDVGNPKEPLQEGDVITIEPGIYLPNESLGIRIEDVYWITDADAVCVSEELPRDLHEVEEFMKGELSDD